MNIKTLLLIAPLAISLVGVANAGGPLNLFGKGKVHCDKSCDHCPCYPTVEEVVVEKPCFEVECEQICVPKVTFPWPWLNRCCGCKGKGKGHGGSNGCCGTRCGHIKTIRVLKTDSYECTECRCNWDVCGKGCSKSAAPGAPAPVEGGDMHGDEIPPPPIPEAVQPSALIHIQQVR